MRLRAKCEAFHQFTKKIPCRRTHGPFRGHVKENSDEFFFPSKVLSLAAKTLMMKGLDYVPSA